MNARSTMQLKVGAYLAERRQAGFVLRIEGQQLTYFARFIDAIGYRGPPDDRDRESLGNRKSARAPYDGGSTHRGIARIRPLLS